MNTLKTRDVAMPELCGVAYMDINEKHDFHCAKPLQGAWVKIWKDKFGESHDVMTLCEVKVIGTRTGTLLFIYFTNCSFMFQSEMSFTCEQPQ